ncbi:MAG: DUF4399 domain-containing protein [Longimicrobiales bacterium]
MINARNLTFALAFGLAACGAPADESTTEEAPAAAPAMTSGAGVVTITEPVDGAEITGRTVVVRLESSVAILPAGDLTPGSGHHHLFLDADVNAPGTPVPTVPGSIVHMGNAASEFTFDSVQPGTHRLIAVVADGVHVPLQPWVVDTITFTTR